MCKFIGIEVLATNALIDIIESNQGRSISLEVLKEYGLEIVHFLEETYGEDVVILYDRNRIGALVLDYSKYFSFKDDVLSVKEGIDVDDLRASFRGPLAFELLSAIINSDIRKLILK